MKPNALWSGYKEGLALSKVNELGYLGPAYPKEKDNKSCFRIGLIGDSYVQGVQAHYPYHFRDILEKKLNQKIHDKRIEVLNFGRSSFVLQDMYCYIKNFVSSYDVDMLIVFLSNGDFTDNSKDPLLPKCSNSGDSIHLLFEIMMRILEII